MAARRAARFALSTAPLPVVLPPSLPPAARRIAGVGDDDEDDDGGDGGDDYVPPPRQRAAAPGPKSQSATAAAPADAPEEEEDYDFEMTDEELHHERTEAEKNQISARCLRLFNVLLTLLGAALTGAALYGSTTGGGGVASSLFYALAGVGAGLVVITLVGLFGALWRAMPMLLAYYACLVFAAFGMLVLGGFCFVLQVTALQWVDQNWASVQATLPAAQRSTSTPASYEATLRLAMDGIGALAFVLLSFLLCTMQHVTRLVTPLKSYMLLLQATNTTLVPVGIALIAVATWVAQTAVGNAALLSAFAIFVLGILVVGFMGTTLRSRVIIRLFFVATLVLALAFSAFGLTALLSGPQVSAFAVAQWPTLRKVLPAGFAGKYDVGQFELFMQANLSALGFIALCTGVLMATQAFGASRLRFELQAMYELEGQVIEAREAGLLYKEEAAELLAMRSLGTLERTWKRGWKFGDRTSRAAVVFLGLFLLFAIAVVVGVAVAALVYSTECLNLSRFDQDYNYGGANVGSFLFVSNNFTRGSISLAVAAVPASAQLLAAALASISAGAAPNTTVSYHKSAYSQTMAPPGYPPVTPRLAAWANGNVDVLYSGSPQTLVPSRSIVALPVGPTSFLGYDVSCQAADIVVTLAPADLLGGNSYTASLEAQYTLALITSGPENDIDIDLSGVNASQVPRLLRADLSTGDGTLDAVGLLVGAKGMAAATAGGAMNFESLDVQCDPADLGDTRGGGVNLLTSTGSIDVDGASFIDCDVLITAGAAPASVENAVLRSSIGGGGGRLAVVGAAGAISISSTSVSFLSISGDSGTVAVSNSSIGRSLRASSGAGDVTLSQLYFGPGSGVQVDTSSGDVTILAAEFAGIVSIVTSGAISCRGAGFDGAAGSACSVRSVELAVDGTQLNVVDQVTVNCAAQSDCPYLGGITITSSTGDVSVTMSPWARGGT